MTNWLDKYTTYASDSETPLKSIYWCGISAVAGALRRNVWLDQGRYFLYPNFFIIIVARPGVVQKTTAINHAMRLLEKLPHIKFAPKHVTWEGFINFLDEQHSAAHGDLGLDTDVVRTASISVVSGEFSLFYDPEDKGMISALTDLWDCPDKFDKVTKFSGNDYLDNPCINLIAATTPSFMREAFDRFSREGGLASRVIFVHEVRKRQLVAHPAKLDKVAQRDLIAGLDRLSRMHGEMFLTVDAKERSREWYENYYKGVESGNILETTGFQDRKQAHVLKLAIVLSCVKRGDYRITLEDFNEALAQIDLVEGDFVSAFESLTDREELRPYKELKAYIEHTRTITRPALLSKFTHKYLLFELDKALGALVAEGSVVFAAGATGPYYRWAGTTSSS